MVGACSRLFKDIPPSSYQYQILGLNLLRLLALNRIAEFHTELELIPLDKHDNIYIKHPIQLEQYIMEGSYNKVFSAAKDLPAPSYSFFIEYLMDLRLKYAYHTAHAHAPCTRVCSYVVSSANPCALAVA